VAAEVPDKLVGKGKDRVVDNKLVVGVAVGSIFADFQILE